MSPPDPEPMVVCSVCAAAGRHLRPLTDPISRALGMGPTCARRRLTGDVRAAASLQLALDLMPEPQPRRPRRVAA